MYGNSAIMKNRAARKRNICYTFFKSGFIYYLCFLTMPGLQFCDLFQSFIHKTIVKTGPDIPNCAFLK
jgi:hypothetical protein